MAQQNSIFIHKGLGISQTDKALLIKIPKLLESQTWYTWVPKSMISDHSETYLEFHFPDKWIFTFCDTNDFNKSKKDWKNPKEIKASTFKEIFTDYETYELDDVLFLAYLEEHRDDIERRIKLLKYSLESMQKLESLPNQIEDLISETDLDSLELLVENINLFIERYKNE